MSRTGSFPLRVAYDLLEKNGRKSSVILDPFCGKGTSLLAARMLGHKAYGIDIAPEAVICSTAKLVNVKFDEICRYIERLPVENVEIVQVPDSVKVFFHPSTLSQVLSIRDRLMRDVHSKSKKRCAQAHVTLTLLLGLLHGHSSYSLSIPSAHAYSMAPNYVAKYAANHALVAPIRDVKACLIKKASRSLKQTLPELSDYSVKQGSALDCSSIFPELLGRADLILTSPPYLNAQTYAKDNWLRLWLLGYDYKVLQKNYIETGSIRRYEIFMIRVFKEISLMLKRGGKFICIAGDVRVRNYKNGQKVDQIFQTGRFLENLCKIGDINFQVEEHERHDVPSESRYFHALNGSNGHSKHKLVERSFIARKM